MPAANKLLRLDNVESSALLMRPTWLGGTAVLAVRAGGSEI